MAVGSGSALLQAQGIGGQFHQENAQKYGQNQGGTRFMINLLLLLLLRNIFHFVNM